MEQSPLLVPPSQSGSPQGNMLTFPLSFSLDFCRMCIYAGFLWRIILSSDAIYLHLTCSLRSLLYLKHACACTEMLLEEQSCYKIFSLKLLRISTIQKGQSVRGKRENRSGPICLHLACLAGSQPGTAFHAAEGKASRWQSQEHEQIFTSHLSHHESSQR